MLIHSLYGLENSKSKFIRAEISETETYKSYENRFGILKAKGIYKVEENWNREIWRPEESEIEIETEICTTWNFRRNIDVEF